MLRSACLRIITELGIEGGCNVQLALAPTAKTCATGTATPATRCRTTSSR